MSNSQAPRNSVSPGSQAPRSGPPPQYKRSMKNMIIDARFQFKYTGILVFAALMVSTFLGIFLARTTDALVEQSNGVMEQSELVVAETKKVSELVRMTMRMNPDYAELEQSFNKTSGETDKEIAQQAHKMQAETREIIRGQKAMLRGVVGGLVALVALIGLIGIYVTHKIAGPVYKMSMLFRHIGDGKLSLKGRLRKGDELQAFFDAFSRMVDKLKLKRKADLDRLEQSIEALRSSGASEAAIAGVVALRDDMKKSLVEE